MAAPSFVAQLNEQIAHEYAAHQQYVACAVYYDSETLPQLARFFYRQALEERDHAMMMVQYLLDAGADAVVPGVAAPRTTFADLVEPVARGRGRLGEPSRQPASPAPCGVAWGIASRIPLAAAQPAHVADAEREALRVAVLEQRLGVLARGVQLVAQAGERDLAVALGERAD